MPRQKLSEYRSKVIISEALELTYNGWSIDASKDVSSQLSKVHSDASEYVVKVDEGVKGRFKKGLVLLNVAHGELSEAVASLTAKGYSKFIIEPQVGHDQSSERYISLISERTGLSIKYTASGGVDVESHVDSIQTVEVKSDINWDNLATETGISSKHLQRLVEAFNDNYFVFLEINPYLAGESGLQVLDAAVEVDDAGEFFVDSWNDTDFRRHASQDLTEEELTVHELNANSPASFNLSVLEPNGSIFLLLSGGGASVVVADEIYNQGYGKQLANYGEYSGNPNTEETYVYTKAVLQLLIKSTAERKVVFIGGAVANFTDIAKTFAGVIHAIDDVADQLIAQHVKFYVRRGGPNQEEGLGQIEALLTRHGLLGAVHSPATPLTVAVNEALQEVANV
ncbi:MAG: ATP citrate lyase citrate-binding domain-containing protein [Patescibacteria group bacterium]